MGFLVVSALCLLVVVLSLVCDLGFLGVFSVGLVGGLVGFVLVVGGFLWLFCVLLLLYLSLIVVI